MSNQIVSSVIGLLTESSERDCWESALIEIPFFDDKKLPITFMDFNPKQDTMFIHEADEALTSFLAKTFRHRNSYSELVFKNYKECVNIIGEEIMPMELREIKSADEIWKFVYPTALFISRRHRNDLSIYLEVSCECAWEDEHGLNIVFRKGKDLIRVSQHDGHLTESDAYGTSDEEDELLSKSMGSQKKLSFFSRLLDTILNGSKNK